MIPAGLENVVYGLVAPPALHLADRHGMLACLVAGGPMTANEVAGELGLDADTVERVLLVLTAARVLHRDDDHRYTVPAELSPYLDAGDHRYLGGVIGHLVADEADRRSTIEACLLKGKPAVDAAPYEHFYRDEASTRRFLRAMWDLSFAASRELARLSELDGRGVLVDVGGGSAAFAVAALELWPRLSAVVFDLAPVGPYVAQVAGERGLGDRLGFVVGDFFRDELPRADVVALGYVMSNWPDAECRALLTKAHRACITGGRVLVLERLFDQDRRGPLSTAAMNLEMQVETHGRHRTAAEYLTLLAAAGFANCSVRRSNFDKHLVIGHRRG